MAVIDASVLIAIFLVQDVHHPASRAWFDHMTTAGEHLAAPILLLTAVAGAISRRTGDPTLGRNAVTWITQLPEIQVFAINDQVWQRAIELPAALGLRGADAVYVALADQLQVPLVRWDREQRLRGSHRIVAREPE